MVLTDDYFAVLGLPRQWQQDRQAVETQYLERSRVHHPDAFVGHDVAAQRAATEASSRLNTAYRVVRDPVARAEYLVKLAGIDLDSNDPEHGAPQPSQAFLIRMIDLRERVAEDLDSERLRDEVEVCLDQAFDAAIAAISGGDIRGAARELVARRYYQRFLDEIEAADVS